MSDIDNLLVPPWSRLPLVHDDTDLFPAETMTALSATYARPAVSSTQQLMALLKSESKDASVAFFGDSTGNETTEWIRLLTGEIAAEWPRWTVNYRLWNDGALSFDAAVTVQTGTGARTLTVYNGSVSGFSTADWAGAKLTAALTPLYPDPELIVVSLGHNEGSTYVEPGWHGRYLGLTEALTAARPGASVLCVAQNPATANEYQGRRAEVYRAIAAHRGYGFLDVHQAFKDTGDPASLTSDGVHPNTAGTALWVATAKKAFVLQSDMSPRTQAPSTFLTAGVDLLINGDFSAYTTAPFGWVATNCTPSQDATITESARGVSLKLTAGAVGATFLQDVLVVQAKGRWVTVKARIYIAAAQGAGVGRVAITDSNGSVISDSLAVGRDGFKDVVLSKFVTSNASYLRVVFYPAHTDGTGVFYIDHVTLTVGKYPSGRPVNNRTLPGRAGTTGNRGSATNAGAGALYFDTTINKPIWSTGAAWVDATGAAV